jgi:hypothetical protein
MASIIISISKAAAASAWRGEAKMAKWRLIINNRKLASVAEMAAKMAIWWLK